jgi:hypothetical protein
MYKYPSSDHRWSMASSIWWWPSCNVSWHGFNSWRDTIVSLQSQIHTITLVKESRISEDRRTTHFNYINWIQTIDQNIGCLFSSNISDTPTEFATTGDLNSKIHTPMHEMKILEGVVSNISILFCYICLLGNLVSNVWCRYQLLYSNIGYRSATVKVKTKPCVFTQKKKTKTSCYYNRRDQSWLHVCCLKGSWAFSQCTTTANGSKCLKDGSIFIGFNLLITKLKWLQILRKKPL